MLCIVFVVDDIIISCCQMYKLYEVVFVDKEIYSMDPLIRELFLVRVVVFVGIRKWTNEKKKKIWN